jgi:hypothetical protein
MRRGELKGSPGFAPKAGIVISSREDNPAIRGVKLLAWISNFGVEDVQETAGFEPGLSYFDFALRRPPLALVSTGSRP